MGGDGSTTGSGADGHRTTKMNKERAAAQKELQNRKDKIEVALSTAGFAC